MELGITGLGRMGATMAERPGHGAQRLMGYDRSSNAVARIGEFDGHATHNIEQP